MGAHWKTAMREKGFDPALVVDAPRRIGIIQALVTLGDMKGAVIGDGENCSGSRCLRRVLAKVLAGKNAIGDLFVFMGASRAIVAWRSPTGKQTGYRFLVNGLPKEQDRTMNVVGELVVLRPPNGSKRLGQAHSRRPKARGRHDLPGNGRNSTTQSLAAQLRSA